MFCFVFFRGGGGENTSFVPCKALAENLNDESDANVPVFVTEVFGDLTEDVVVWLARNWFDELVKEVWPGNFIEVGLDNLVEGGFGVKTFDELIENAGEGCVTEALEDTGGDFVAKFDIGVLDELEDDIVWVINETYEDADENVVIGFVIDTLVEAAEADDCATATGRGTGTAAVCW